MDIKRKRKFKYFPNVSFIIPCYNDGDTIKETVKGIYESYPHNKFDLTIINDCSTDNTPEMLRQLSKKYKFKVITNKKNIGKVRSINKAIIQTKGEYVFIVDSDLILNKEAVKDIFARFQQNDNIAAVSCRYAPRNDNFLTKLQKLDYNMQGLINGAYNVTSTIALWGGDMVIKRKALMEVGLFSPNMLTEDLDMALKLNKHGWKVEQSFLCVDTFVPKTVNALIKQRIRWGVGGFQCFIKHTGVYMKNPLVLIFMVSFGFLGILFALSLLKLLLGTLQIYHLWEALEATGNGFLKNVVDVYNTYDSNVWDSLKLKLIFGLLNLPAIFIELKDTHKYIKLLLYFPLVLIYYPLVSLLYLLCLPKGLYVALRYKKEDRGW